MKTGILAILMLLSLSAIILNGGPLFTEQRITHGSRIYETIREASAESRPITLTKEGGRELVRFVDNAISREWRVRWFVVAVSFLVFAGLLGIIVAEYREKAMGNFNDQNHGSPYRHT